VRILERQAKTAGCRTGSPGKETGINKTKPADPPGERKKIAISAVVSGQGRKRRKYESGRRLHRSGTFLDDNKFFFVYLKTEIPSRLFFAVQEPFYAKTVP